MLAVADSGGQSAFLAPTEVLAGQHLRSLVATLGPISGRGCVRRC
jgi:ATP-dependent DNA helicase RecG